MILNKKSKILMNSLKKSELKLHNYKNLFKMPIIKKDQHKLKKKLEKFKQNQKLQKLN